MHAKEASEGVDFIRSRHYNGREASAVKVGYVESKLDESIKNLKEAMDKADRRHEENMKSIKETMDKADQRHKEAMEKSEARQEAERKASEARLAADREASEARLKADREEFNKRFAEERKEWHSTKRWLYINFGSVIALIVTIVVAFMNGTTPN